MSDKRVYCRLCGRYENEEHDCFLVSLGTARACLRHVDPADVARGLAEALDLMAEAHAQVEMELSFLRKRVGYIYCPAYKDWDAVGEEDGQPYCLQCGSDVVDGKCTWGQAPAE